MPHDLSSLSTFGIHLRWIILPAGGGGVDQVCSGHAGHVDRCHCARFPRRLLEPNFPLRARAAFPER